MAALQRKRQPTVITWLARGCSAFILVICLAIVARYPHGADFDDLNALLSTLLIAALVVGIILCVGERDKK